MHERLADQDLVVLTISYEKIDLIKNFLATQTYSMPAGSDPNRAVINAYGVTSFPSTAVIGRDGKLIWKGSPYGAERVVEKALGLPADAGGALGAYRTTPSQRTLEHLLQKATTKFDLAAWAKSVDVPALPENKKPAKLKPTAALDKAMGGDDAGVHSLRAGGPAHFDLGVWARARYRKQFPFKKAELKTLLEQRRYRTIMNAFLLRKTSGAVMKAAARNDAFAEICRNGFKKEGVMARKGIMAKNWVFANRQPTDNDGFWREMSVSGMATSEDRKRVVGVILGGTMVSDTEIDQFIDSALMRHLLMQEIAKGNGSSTAKLAKQVKKSRGRILAEFKGKYGWADPRGAK